MKWLIGALAAIGAVAAVAGFFLQRNRKAASSFLSDAQDTTSSWGKTAAEKAGEATDKVAAMGDKAASAASDAV
jgi:hypothetical protein